MPAPIPVLDPPAYEEWIDLDEHGIQAWFSSGQQQHRMRFHEAAAYCSNKNSSNLFEPTNQQVLEDVMDIARRANITVAWIGITDTVEEGV